MQIRFKGRIIHVEQGMVELPNGVSGEFEVVRHPGGSAVVALDDVRRVCLLRQYRVALDEWLWELPAGKLEHPEAPIDAARRELEEEAGVRARRWAELGQMIASPGILDERVYLFMATGLLRPTHGVGPDPEEVYELEWRAMDEALAMTLDGRICDAKTIVGLHRAARAVSGDT